MKANETPSTAFRRRLGAGVGMLGVGFSLWAGLGLYGKVRTEANFKAAVLAASKIPGTVAYTEAGSGARLVAQVYSREANGCVRAGVYIKKVEHARVVCPT